MLSQIHADIGKCNTIDLIKAAPTYVSSEFGILPFWRKGKNVKVGA